MFASSFIESAGRDRKFLRASSFTALNLLFSRCTTRNFLNVDQTVWAQHTGLIFSDFETFSVLQGREVWLSPFWRCAAVGEEVDLFRGAPHKGFLLDFKFHPGNSSPNAKKACCQRWSITGNKKGKIGETFGYPFAQSFSCAGASFHRNTCIFPFDQKGRFSTGCITIGDVQQVDSGIG